LYAEDDPNDVLLLKLALRKARAEVDLRHLTDGADALEYLRAIACAGPNRELRLPGLILLDLKMPMLGGFDVLEWLRLQPVFKNVPTYILSSSALESDKARARQLGATGYFVKSSDFSDVVETLNTLLPSPSFPSIKLASYSVLCLIASHTCTP
jgi:two-component system response regulator